MAKANYDMKSLEKDREKIISMIKDVFQRHIVKLKETLEGYGSNFWDKMLEKELIKDDNEDDYEKIMMQYMAGLQPDRVDSIENHCRTFITILKDLGTASDPLLEEALQLEQDIITERCRERIS